MALRRCSTSPRLCKAAIVSWLYVVRTRPARVANSRPNWRSWSKKKLRVSRLWTTSRTAVLPTSVLMRVTTSTMPLMADTIRPRASLMPWMRAASLLPGSTTPMRGSPMMVTSINMASARDCTAAALRDAASSVPTAAPNARIVSVACGVMSARPMNVCSMGAGERRTSHSGSDRPDSACLNSLSRSLTQPIGPRRFSKVVTRPERSALSVPARKSATTLNAG